MIKTTDNKSIAFVNSGGRNITISGMGFNLVQNFSMMAMSRSRREKRQVDGDSAQLVSVFSLMYF